MQVAELIDQSRAKVARLRQELAEEERFLAMLEARTHRDTANTKSDDTDHNASPSPEPGGATPPDNGLRKATPSEKTEIIFEIIDRQLWAATAEMRHEMRGRGIDPDRGTEVKRIVWGLHRDGDLIRHGNHYARPGTRLPDDDQGGLEL